MRVVVPEMATHGGCRLASWNHSSRARATRVTCWAWLRARCAPRFRPNLSPNRRSPAVLVVSGPLPSESCHCDLATVAARNRCAGTVHGNSEQPVQEPLVLSAAWPQARPPCLQDAARNRAAGTARGSSELQAQDQLPLSAAWPWVRPPCLANLKTQILALAPWRGSALGPRHERAPGTDSPPSGASVCHDSPRAHACSNFHCAGNCRQSTHLAGRALGLGGSVLVF